MNILAELFHNDTAHRSSCVSPEKKGIHLRLQWRSRWEWSMKPSANASEQHLAVLRPLIRCNTV